ncbi:ABC transporter permease [Candidatus Desulfarcum epimagneticum]|uniref:Putative glutamine transport system permease protein GlnP n=1 Tax=uncultured Desulfobacteraceae bacterium TaxID=218296 RepID=A0A484HMR1_9BACT|nr:ABC transporter permease [uncultured Desulfobacteraceae bacterium]
MASELTQKTFWFSCLALILVVLGWGLTEMTDRINYKWYWNRVPQYFFFTENVEHFPSGPGVVRVTPAEDQRSRVEVTAENGATESFKVLTDTLEVKTGDHVSDTDMLGSNPTLSTGILIIGLITTLEISVYASLLGLVIGLFAGLGRISKNPMLKGLATIYVEIIRGTPLLVQIFIFYFFIGSIMEFDRFFAGVMALAIFAGAYVAEIIRAGIQSINPGQMEAARSLGMNYLQAMVTIILPQAFKRILPPLAGQFISLIKDSSLVSVIAITDLTKAGREVITSTFATFEIWFTVAGMYLVLTFSLSMVVRYIERRFSVSD